MIRDQHLDDLLDRLIEAARVSNEVTQVWQDQEMPLRMARADVHDYVATRIRRSRTTSEGELEGA